MISHSVFIFAALHDALDSVLHKVHLRQRSQQDHYSLLVFHLQAVVCGLLLQHRQHK